MRISLIVVLSALTVPLAPAASERRDERPLTAYDQLIAEFKSCKLDERCAIAGGVKGCRCPGAVRAEAKARIDAAAQAATCPAVERLYCPPLKDPRCEASVCTATPVLE